MMNRLEAYNYLEKLLVEKKIPSRYLGKYRSLDAVRKFVENNQLYFAKFEEFNDPFEACYNLDLPHSVNSGIEGIRDSINQLYNHASILSLSASFDSMLMWSHYADKHHGDVLVFDILKAPEQFYVPASVIYPRNREFPHIDPYTDIRCSVEPIRYKYYGWQHEKEVRIISYDGQSGLRPIDPKALKAIIFGCKVTEKERTEIVEMVKSSGRFVNCKFRKCLLHPQKYKVCLDGSWGG